MSVFFFLVLFLFKCALPVCVRSDSHSQQLILVDNANVVAPQTYDPVMVFNTTSQQLVSYPTTTIPTADEVVSGAIVCQQRTYIAVWVNMAQNSWGLFSFDLINHTVTTYQPTADHYHAFQCTSDPHTVLAVGSRFADADADADADLVYELNRVTFSANTITETRITQFSGTGTDIYYYGYDSIFSFAAPATQELWISWANKQGDSGTLDIYDTRTGAKKSSHAYPRSVGLPYLAMPSTLDSHGVFSGLVRVSLAEADMEFYKWQITEGSSTALKRQSKSAANDLYSAQPYPVCGSVGYSIGEMIPNKVVAFDTGSGQTIQEYELVGSTRSSSSDGQQVECGALACF